MGVAAWLQQTLLLTPSPHPPPQGGRERETEPPRVTHTNAQSERAMTDTAAPSPALRAIRWRTHLDHVLVFAVIIALWSLATWRFGTYWVSSPWAVAIRFVEMVASGELIRHAGYTLAEAARGHADRRRAGGAAAAAAAAASGDGRDPRSVHGRRLWRAQARIRAAVHRLVRHRHGVEDRAGGQRRVLHRLFRDAERRARARRQARADGADFRRQRTAGRAPYRVTRRDAVDLRRLPHRRALRHRRRR